MKSPSNHRPRAPLLLPAPLQRQLEGLALDFIRPERSPPFDFSSPQGEPALTNPDSVSWKIFKNPVALYIGGMTAVLLELAEPRVRTGVWEHTSFRSAPRQRLRRTGFAAMMTVYGPRSRTEQMISKITQMHSRITGFTPSGQAYRADDPELLRWVHATAGFGFLQAYTTYVEPLDARRRDLYYSEGSASAQLYGAQGAPASQAEVEALFNQMHALLAPSPIILEFIAIMRSARVLPRALAPMQPMFARAAIEILPVQIKQRLGLDTAQWRLAAWQRAVVRRAAALADRLMLRSGPAVQACRRLGLPDDYLYL